MLKTSNKLKCKSGYGGTALCTTLMAALMYGINVGINIGSNVLK